MANKLSGLHIAILSIMAAVIFLDNISETSMFIAAPIIMHSYNASISVIQWILVGYMLVAGSFQVLFGQLADNYGFKPIFLLGIIIFILASLLSALAISVSSLILWRILQGFGYAMTFPLIITLGRLLFPENRFGFVMGFLGSFAAVSLAVGPILSAFILQYANWRWLFAVNVPIGIFIFIFSVFILKPSKVIHQRKINYFLHFIFLGYMALILLILNPVFIAYYFYIFLGLVILSMVTIIFYWQNRSYRKNKKLAPSFKFKSSFYAGVSIRFLVQIVIYGLFFIFSFLFQTVYAYSLTQTGLLFLVPLFIMSLFSPVVGKIIDRIGPHKFVLVGIIILMISILLFYFLSDRRNIALLLAILFFFGCGATLLIPSCNVLTFLGVDKSRSASASGIYYTAVTISGAFSVALCTLIFENSHALKHNTNFLLHHMYTSQRVISNNLNTIHALTVLASVWLCMIAISLFYILILPLFKNLSTTSEGTVAKNEPMP